MQPDRAGRLQPQPPSPFQAPSPVLQPWGQLVGHHTEHSVLSWGRDSKGGTPAGLPRWALEAMPRPHTTFSWSRARQKGQGLLEGGPSLQRPTGAMRSAHRLLRGPSPLNPVAPLEGSPVP